MRLPLVAPLTVLIGLFAGCRTAVWREPVPNTWDAVHALLAPPPAVPAPTDAVDASTLDGKVMAGYQGWFVAHDDGSGLGWTHYGVATRRADPLSPRRFAPGAAVIDLWPDLSEAGRTERYPTDFRHADGSVAEVFTSRHPDTIDRHLRWMRDYGVDGVFLQRFATTLGRMPHAAVRNQILGRVRASAARHGRTWAIMYDLSGMREGAVEKAVMEDWKRLVDIGGIRSDPRLQRHRGRPVVAVWGIGFNDGRRYTLDECERLVRWLKEDPVYGGNAVVIGVPYYWRTLDRDTTRDPALHRICEMADVVSPWAVGRLRTVEDATARGAVVAADLAWTRERGGDYLPVIFPGFTWHNLQKSRGVEAPSDQIPRRGGEFYRAQADATISAGARMLYVAMFDEIDEGTAIMKTSGNPPVGESPFVAEPGVPSDHYLKLTGEIRARLRQATATVGARSP
jgi:hypothetical protein